MGGTKKNLADTYPSILFMIITLVVEIAFLIAVFANVQLKQLVK